ncbi:hypothetical protein VFPBJ_03638 [Purpureocillium lilacinum]|uniref:Uncharacterized protein n=1 Tax=Purpureocillium lilacinum TaxID=33203 RepID=A0A179H5L4_PURLI|nr:hypothetical protein VFPBJ_03638 [Purpureocillium lilacinum]
MPLIPLRRFSIYISTSPPRHSFILPASRVVKQRARKHGATSACPSPSLRTPSAYLLRAQGLDGRSGAPTEPSTPAFPYADCFGAALETLLITCDGVQAASYTSMYILSVSRSPRQLGCQTKQLRGRAATQRTPLALHQSRLYPDQHPCPYASQQFGPGFRDEPWFAHSSSMVASRVQVTSR